MPDSRVALSVVIPLYNKRSTVLRSVDSVVRQLKIGDELIVVDDGSTDGGADAVARKYKGSPVVKLIRQQNRGVSVARNEGVRNARHPYVAFLDADDWWLEGMRDKLEELIRRWPCAEAWSVGHYRVEGTQRFHISSGISVDKLFSGIEFIEHYARYSGVICSSSVCVRKDALLREGGFPNGAKSGEDVYLWLKLALTGSIAASPEPLVCIDHSLTSDRKGRDAVGFHYVYFSDRDNLLVLDKKKRGALRRFMVKNGIRQIGGAIARGDRLAGWLITRVINRVVPGFALFASVLMLLPRSFFLAAYRRRYGHDNANSM